MLTLDTKMAGSLGRWSISITKRAESHLIQGDFLNFRAKIRIIADFLLYLRQELTINRIYMTDLRRFGQSDDYRREELIRVIEHAVENLTLPELEALYYDMSTKNFIND